MGEYLLLCSLFGTLAVAILAAVRHFCGRRISPAVMVFLWILVGLRFFVPAAIPVGDFMPAHLPEGTDTTAETAYVSTDISPVEDITTMVPPAETTAPSVVPPEPMADAEMPEIPMETPAVPDMLTETIPVDIVADASMPIETVVKGETTAPLSADTPTPVNIPWKTVAAAVWLTGVVCLTGWFTVLYIRLRIQLRGGTICTTYDLPPLIRPVTVKKLPTLASPMTVGILHPLILLPSDSETDRAVVCHEFSHIRRWDGLTKLFLLTVAVVHWWNPVVWLYLRLAHRDMELASDRAALTMLDENDVRAYGRVLLSYAEKRQTIRLGLHFGESGLKERIDMLLDKRKTSPVLCLMLCLGMLFTLVCCGPAVTDNTEALAAELERITAENAALEKTLAEAEQNNRLLQREQKEEADTQVYLQNLLSERTAQKEDAQTDMLAATQKQQELQQKLVEASALVQQMVTELPGIYISSDPEMVRTTAEEATAAELTVVIAKKQEQIAVVEEMVGCLKNLRVLCMDEAEDLQEISDRIGDAYRVLCDAGEMETPKGKLLFNRQAAVIGRWFETGRREENYQTQISNLEAYLTTAKEELAAYQRILVEKQVG